MASEDGGIERGGVEGRRSEGAGDGFRIRLTRALSHSSSWHSHGNPQLVSSSGIGMKRALHLRHGTRAHV